ncbi:hypothetical protein [uncultured Catenibacterium sp.]|uniref:hypothetical protein n=1 Tax=uncultured Catenibacterium sp. TaxID=286142 RepID=UPI0025E39FC8|nr:hypothetical protein [uncultured Catenibacterium sp.]
MLESYKEITSISLNKLKDYLDVIDVYHDSFIDTCRSQKKIEAHIKTHQKKYLGLALKKLYEIDDMQCLENHLVMIEYLFGDHPRIQSLNKKLCNYMLHNGSPIDVYRIVRHLMPFSYLALISILVEKEVITYAQAAYFSLVEEDIEGAYDYLDKYEVEPDESLLNLYASYDLIGYFLLVDHYSKKVSYQVSGGIRWEKKCGLSSHY